MNRIEAIENAAARRDNEAQRKAEAERNEMNRLVKAIEEKSKEVFPRIFPIAEALVRNGYYIGDKKSWDASPTFCTDGICHRMGFFLASGNPYLGAKGSMPVAFGHGGGGWDGKDFKVDRYGNVISFDWGHFAHRERMRNYCENIEKFEKELNAWVDSL